MRGAKPRSLVAAFHRLRDSANTRERVTVAALELGRELDRLADPIRAVNQLGAKSDAVNLLIAPYLEREGFTAEQTMTTGDLGLFPRPDFISTTFEGRGILIEVERGGVTTNNRDLLDLWKCHLHQEMAHLFLVVPGSLPTAKGKDRGVSTPRLVARRMSAFFGDERREVDVSSVHVFSYGSVPKMESVASSTLPSPR